MMLLMVYQTTAIREEQIKSLAAWQFRQLTRRNIRIVLLICVLLAVLITEPYVRAGIGIFIAAFLILLAWRKRSFYAIWMKESQIFPDKAFLTVTDAGILHEAEGLSLYYPWNTYKRVDIVDGVLVLFLPCGLVHFWNVQSAAPNQRTELLNFAALRVGKDSRVVLAPPSLILSEHPIPEFFSTAQARETGDIIRTYIQPFNHRKLVVGTLIYAVILCFFILSWAEEPDCFLWAAGCVIFTWHLSRGLLLLKHPGRYYMKQLNKAYSIQDRSEPKRFSDGHAERIIYPDGRWMKINYAFVRDVFRGDNVTVLRHSHAWLSYPNTAVPASLPEAAEYHPQTAPFRLTFGICLLLACGTACLIYVSPRYPCGYLLWLLGLI